mgnify:FL=1
MQNASTVQQCSCGHLLTGHTQSSPDNRDFLGACSLCGCAHFTPEESPAPQALDRLRDALRGLLEDSRNRLLLACHTPDNLKKIELAYVLTAPNVDVAAAGVPA